MKEMEEGQREDGARALWESRPVRQTGRALPWPSHCLLLADTEVTCVCTLHIE